MQLLLVNEEGVPLTKWFDASHYCIKLWIILFLYYIKSLFFFLMKYKTIINSSMIWNTVYIYIYISFVNKYLHIYFILNNGR